MATILRVDGSKEEVYPANGRDFQLRELQHIVGGHIEIIQASDGIMVVNEEGKLQGLPRNEQATALAFPQDSRQAVKEQNARMRNEGWFVIDATGGEPDYIAGPALICKDSEVR